MRRLAPLIACAMLAGCGGSEKTAAPPASAADTKVRRALHLPDRVPLRADGDAPAEDVAVVRAWLDELSRGDVEQAAQRFGLPARFQNITSVALIKTEAQAVAVTNSLPCGAKMTTAGGASGFVVYEARLIDRPGGACGTGVGGVVRGAVLVRDGHMIEWYRLPDRSPGTGSAGGPVV